MGLNPIAVIFLILPSLAYPVLANETTGHRPLTSFEADTVIKQQMENRALQEASRKAKLEAIPAIQSRVIQKDGYRVTINRVAPPEINTEPAPIPKEESVSKPLTPSELAAHIAAQPEQQSISLSVTVFDEEHSKVLWREPNDDQQSGKGPREFELWSNINLNYLRPISSFNRDDVVYYYFGFSETITREGEARRSAFAKERGYDYESRWQEPPVDFTAGQPEYVVVNNGSQPIPPELYQQMDALFVHYLENEATFKTAHLDSESLRKAKGAYLKENPPAAKDVIINHWPASKGGQR